MSGTKVTAIDQEFGINSSDFRRSAEKSTASVPSNISTECMGQIVRSSHSDHQSNKCIMFSANLNKVANDLDRFGKKIHQL